MSKKSLTIILLSYISFILFSIVSVQAASHSAVDQKYNAKLKSIRKTSNTGIDFRYIDITGDGTRECLVIYQPKGMGGSARLFEVYSLTKGKVNKILSFTHAVGSCKCIYYTKTKSLVFYAMAHGGRERYAYFKMQSNGKYKYIGEKARIDLSIGINSNADGKWHFYNGNDRTITEKKFKALTSGLLSGKKRSFSKWSYKK